MRDFKVVIKRCYYNWHYWCNTERSITFTKYRVYSGKGISCEFTSSEELEEYAKTLPNYSDLTSLLRIDTSKNFCKGNLHWKDQNTRKVIPKTILGHAWDGLNRRCTDTSYQCYSSYGGRGITNKFKSSKEFYDYAETLPNWKKGMQLDRIDTNGHYEKGNLRWVLPVQNSATRRKSGKLLDGVRRCKGRKPSSQIRVRKEDGTFLNKHLGTYETEYEAHEAFVFAHIMLHGEAVFKLSDYIKD